MYTNLMLRPLVMRPVVGSRSLLLSLVAPLLSTSLDAANVIIIIIFVYCSLSEFVYIHLYLGLFLAKIDVTSYTMYTSSYYVRLGYQVSTFLHSYLS